MRRKSGKPRPAARGRAPQPPALRPLSILLAEDSPVNQTLAIGLLTKYGHQLDVANNGREAVEWYHRRSYDVVLMDVQMPEMDGLEATKIIRAHEQQTGRYTPIVAMTAHAMKGDRERCLEAGMDDYVSKPIRVHELFEAIGRVLGKKTTLEEAEEGAPKEEAEQEPSPPVHGLVNWSAVLEAVQGDQELLRNLVQVFFEESSELITEMRSAMDNRDPARLTRAAHTLKGQFRIFGAAVAEHLAFHIENTARDGRLDVADAFSKLQQQVQGIRAELRDFLAGRISLDHAQEASKASTEVTGDG